MTEELLYSVDGDVAYVTLNRPAARNALTFAMYERLAEVCASLKAQDAVRALVITGAGDKAFAAGTDIAQFRAFSTPEDAIAYEERIERVLTALEDCPVPTIAAIAGACTGGGAAIAACCDLRIAASNARFGFPIARTLGNCLSVNNYARLAALIGPARVKDLIFTSRLIDAAEAQGIGLVSEVVADVAHLPSRAAALAKLVAGQAPLTLRATKEALARIRRANGSPQGDDLVVACYTSADFKEGIESFLGKRPPRWLGR